MSKSCVADVSADWLAAGVISGLDVGWLLDRRLSPTAQLGSGPTTKTETPFRMDAET